jgi:hypothetical protein
LQIATFILTGSLFLGGVTESLSVQKAVFAGEFPEKMVTIPKNDKCMSRQRTSQIADRRP